MNRVIRLLLLSAVMAALICGCKSKKNTPEDARLKDNLYTNRFFGFGLQIPNTWAFPDKPSKRDIKKGISLLGFNKQIASEAADATDEAHCLLLTKELLSEMSLVVMAQSVRATPGIRSGKDLLDETLPLITGEGKPFQQVGQPALIRLGNLELYGVKMSVDPGGRKQYQGMFAAVHQGYALLMMPGAKTESGVDDVLRKVGVRVPQASPPPSGPPSRNVAKVESQPPPWINQLKLQGISGSDSRRFAIINGKTFAAGDADKVKTSAKTVTVSCLAIKEASVTVTIEGVEGEWELRLAGN